ncbi:MAG: hypothetical protein OEM38_07300 [Gammaproteobacteria bacterium]|nr:hypothetical protein [Gammaproteobacteria bacterium]
MSSSAASINNIKKQYFNLSKGIRRLLITGVFAAAYAVLDMAVIQPLMEEYSDVTKSIEKVKADGKGFAAQLLNLQGTVGIDPSLSDKKQLEVATIKLTELENDITAATSKFVTPQQMSRFLSELIKRSGKLELISMENHEYDSVIVKTTREIPAVEKAPQKGAKPINVKPIIEVIGEDNVYKHSVRLVLRGKYADIASYLNEIEKMPWRLFWQELNLKTESHPYSRIELEIYTLSLNKNWLTL